MQVFKDKEGTEWQLECTLQTALEIEAHDFGPAMGVEGDDPVPFRIKFINPEEKLFTEYLANHRVCFDLIWIIVKDQAVPQGITDMEQFAKRLDGPSFRAAKLALWEELPNFFQDQKMRLKASIQSLSLAEEMLDRKGAELLLREMSPEQMEKLIDRELQKVREG